MARLVTKFGYLKEGDSRGGYVKYIATREGVEKLDESLRGRPATIKQREFIQKLLEDFPDAKELLEYEDYLKSPTLGSASDFITQAVEFHAGDLMNRSGYLHYQGENRRPWAARNRSLGNQGRDKENIRPRSLRATAVAARQKSAQRAGNCGGL